MTSCTTAKGSCEQTSRCTVREPLRKVSKSIEEVLGRLTIWEMTEQDDSVSDLVTLR
jgi:DNA-binding IscR family transcriptional regulator